MGCQEMVDSDVWWHVRAGQWIWQHRAVPSIDPFSFPSADRPWIDLHWLFQLMLAGAHAAGDDRGMVVLAASLCAVVAALGVTARDRRWPGWVVAACWLPALALVSARSAPRPELISMLAMAAYLAVLQRADERPAMLWILPVVQVVWVNAQGLFVLGPIILGLYLVDRIVRRGSLPIDRSAAARLVAIGAVVPLACLVNPYGWRGALLPLELFPKITALGGLYKSYIIELMDLRRFVARQGTSIAAANLYNQVECFLLWLLPLSWIVPSAWRAARRRLPAEFGAAAFVLAAGLVLVGALGLPGQGTPGRLIAAGRLAPIGLAAVGLLSATWLVRSSRRSALIAVVGGMASATWMIWLRAYLFGAESGLAAWLGVPGRALVPLAATAGLLGIAAAGLSVAAGARVFRIGLAATFGYLALQAIRNAGFFALAAGFVLAANLGEWAAELADSCPARRSSPDRRLLVAAAARAVVAGAAVALIATTVSGTFFRATGERRAFGLSASPRAYAHDAARFAGGPGLPGHALVYSLRQAGVYIFHNGPERKGFLDGRLEVPAPETFQTYVELESRLAEDRGGWSQALERLGDPVVLLDHEAHSGAEATLLADPAWRCIFYDGVGSVFVSRRLRGLDAPYPTVDFLARHFDDAAWQAAPSRRLGRAEGEALLGVASALRGRPGAGWSLRASLLLPACDRLRQAALADPADAGAWALLGDAIDRLTPDPAIAGVPPTPNEPWDPGRSLALVQASACYRRALERDPGEIRALFALYRSYGARRMIDARASVAAMMRRAWAAAVLGDPNADAGPDPGLGAEPPAVAPPSDRDDIDGADLAPAVADRISRGYPEEAVRLLDQARARGRAASWSARDRVAVALLYLGRPDEARAVWLGVTDAPSPGLQAVRLATAALAALDFAAAARAYRAALAAQPDLGEAWFGLAWLYTQSGGRDAARTACRNGLACALSPAQRVVLRGLERLVDRRVAPDGSRPEPGRADRGDDVREGLSPARVRPVLHRVPLGAGGTGSPSTGS